MTAPDPLTLVVKTAEPYPLLPNEALDHRHPVGQGERRRAGDVRPAGMQERRHLSEDRGVQRRHGRDRHRALQARALHQGRPHHPGAQRRLLGREAGSGSASSSGPITSAGPRVAALLAGDVDLIENVPIQDLERDQGRTPNLKVVQGLSNRVIYLHFNYLDDAPPGVADAGGKNPFRDKRVREAISKAIDRDAIVARIMGGVAVRGRRASAADDVRRQQGHEGAEGRRGRREEAARRRRLSRTASRWCSARPNDRYINDGQIAQAVAQMLARDRHQGLGRRHDGEPVLRQAQQGANSASGWRAGAPTPARCRRRSSRWSRRRTATRAWGTTNPGGYSNPEGRRAPRTGARHRRRRQARRAPGRGEPRRHGRLRRAAAALRDDAPGPCARTSATPRGRPEHPGDQIKRAVMAGADHGAARSPLPLAGRGRPTAASPRGGRVRAQASVSRAQATARCRPLPAAGRG